MTANELRSELSKAPVFLELRFATEKSDIDLAHATGFLAREGDQEYLITNWHNVTGLRIDNKHPISDTAALPNYLRAYIGYFIMSGQQKILQWIPHNIRLFRDGAPVWFQHPYHPESIDCVALPTNLPAIKGGRILHKTKNEFPMDSVVLEPGIDCFIVGYPRGLVSQGKLPIWKRASIASEPGMDVEGLPKMYVDTAGREGLSGAPVFVRYHGFVKGSGRIGADNKPDTTMGVHERFIGIYSGRVGDDQLGAQLGIVWKDEAIMLILQSGHLGNHPSIPDLSAISESE